MAGIVPWNDDVVVEILLRLPAKSLTRFKSVCKHWFSLISNHHFCRLHTLRRPNPQPSLILRTHTSHYFYFNPFLNHHKLMPYSLTIPNSKILNSCNGLLLLVSGHPEEYYVYNSTTKQSRKIGLTDGDEYTNVLGLTLAFDPSKSPHYQIVCVKAAGNFSSGHERHCRIEVYDSQTLKWRLCLEPFTAPTSANFSSGVHCNNAIHWESYPRAHLYYNISKNVIGNLPHAQVPWRSNGGGAASHCQLQESNGHLYHFIIVSHQGDKSIAVYELQEDYSQWFLKYHDEFGQLPGRFRVLSYKRGDGGETCTMVTHVPGKITAYRFLNKSSEELVDLTNQPFYLEQSVQFDSRDVFQFGETMAPV